MIQYYIITYRNYKSVLILFHSQGFLNNYQVGLHGRQADKADRPVKNVLGLNANIYAAASKSTDKTKQGIIAGPLGSLHK
jgi:hypothetical protein